MLVIVKCVLNSVKCVIISCKGLLFVSNPNNMCVFVHKCANVCAIFNNVCVHVRISVHNVSKSPANHS